MLHECVKTFTLLSRAEINNYNIDTLTSRINQNFFQYVENMILD